MYIPLRNALLRRRARSASRSQPFDSLFELTMEDVMADLNSRAESFGTVDREAVPGR